MLLSFFRTRECFVSSNGMTCLESSLPQFKNYIIFYSTLRMYEFVLINVICQHHHLKKNYVDDQMELDYLIQDVSFS